MHVSDARAVVIAICANSRDNSAIQTVGRCFDSLVATYRVVVSRYAGEMYGALPKTLIHRFRRKTYFIRLVLSTSDYAVYQLFLNTCSLLKQRSEENPVFVTALATAATWELTGRVCAAPPDELFLTGGTSRFGGIDKYIAYQSREVRVPDKAAWLLVSEASEIFRGTPNITDMIPLLIWVGSLQFDLLDVFGSMVLGRPESPEDRKIFEQAVERNVAALTQAVAGLSALANGRP